MLYSGEVEDEGHTGDEDQVEEAHGWEEVGNFSQVGTAQEHFKQNLGVDRKQDTDLKRLFWMSLHSANKLLFMNI